MTLDGSPPVPCKWSGWNSGTSVVVDYIPVLGRNNGPGQRIAELALTCEAEDGRDTHVEIAGEVPGAGLVQAYVGAPGGSGPLTGSCFEQGYNFNVEMVAPRPELILPANTQVRSGERIVTGDNGTAVLIVPGVGFVRIRGGSDVGYACPGNRIVFGCSAGIRSE